MSDKASCSGGDVRSLHVEDDTAKMGKHQEDEEKEEEKRDEEKEEEKEKEDEEKHDDKVIEVGDYSNMEAPSSLKTLCRYVETTLLPEDKILQFTIDKGGMEEIGATVVAVYMRYLHDVLKKANMTNMVGFIDPATVSANSGTIADRSRLVAGRLQKTDGEQIFMMPYNPGDGHCQKMGVSKPLSGCTNTEEVLPYIEQHMIHIKTADPKLKENKVAAG
ncbi:hypothetical protein L3X38_033467 [Prunus dulcis]|uniref:Uncharacterized protein n=1 Tax=Prunus dulcis TaxID=3755 RepID=A0AAD4VHE8_PRUDU|nr:hypothetical protein L3X38_033467 [Prunus dulcis]